MYDKKFLLEVTEHSTFMLAPGIVSEIKSLSEIYDDSIIDMLFERYHLPVMIFTKEEFKKIIHQIIEDKDFNIEKTEKMLVSKYKKYVSTL